MEYSGLIQQQQRVSDGEIRVQMDDGTIKERPSLSVHAVSSDSESLIGSDIEDETENTLFDGGAGGNTLVTSRPLSKDDMLLLPPLPQALLPSRQSSIVSATEIESLGISTNAMMTMSLNDNDNHAILPLPSLNHDHDHAEYDHSVDYTLQDLSKALEISDLSSRVHSRNVSMSSLSSMTNSNTNTNTNININIKTHGIPSTISGPISASSSTTMSSPTVMPSFSFGSSTNNNNNNNNNSSSSITMDTTSRNNSNTSMIMMNKRFFPISLSRQNSITSTNTITSSTKIKARSRSLSNSNIFRKLSLGSIKPKRILENEVENEVEPYHEPVSPHQRMNNTTNNSFIIGNISTMKELTKFEKINFHNNEFEQETYIHELVELQKKDDMLFDIIIKKITKDNWSSKEEINDLKLRRIKLNELWAKKINFYQNL